MFNIYHIEVKRPSCRNILTGVALVTTYDYVSGPSACLPSNIVYEMKIFFSTFSHPIVAEKSLPNSSLAVF